jgi:hypothetical protein
LLPLYDAIARVKSQGALADRRAGELRHRREDGWYAHERELPISVKVPPQGMTNGLHVRF